VATRVDAHHLYVVVEGSWPRTDHIQFRNYLRQHPDAAVEYASLKKALAERYGEDRLGYTDAKTEFVTNALRAAGSSQERSSR